MTNIIIYGDNSDTLLEDLILNELSDRYTVYFCKKGEVITCGNGYELLVVSVEQLNNINITSGILLFKSSAAVSGGIKIEGALTAVADSQNTKCLSMLSQHNIPTITCGLSDRDSVTYSSRTSDTAVIALQRNITALSGKQIEPLEIPLETAMQTSVSGYEILAYTALRLLLDDFNSKMGNLF